MSNDLTRPTLPEGGLSRLHLVSVSSLSDGDITYLLKLTDYYHRGLQQGRTFKEVLIGRTQINLFFENSTRTNCSFELAGKKLGADVIVVPIAASSVHKGEDLRDTVQTLAAMGADAMVIRHKEVGIIKFIAEALGQVGLPCAIINAGEGTSGHPTQALLDVATLLTHFNRTAEEALHGLTITICGDVKHSRVASSNIELMTRLGANVRLAGPPHLMPAADIFPAIPRAQNLKEGLQHADVIMTLRMQLERMSTGPGIAQQDYYDNWAITRQSLSYAKPDAIVMHPGPMNRGVEIEAALADDRSRAVILDQVSHGVAARMAVLDAFLSE